MKNKHLAVPAIAVALLLTGCTEIEIRKQPEGTIEGIPYALPQKTFLITVEYELQECSAEAKPGQEAILALAVVKTVTLTSTVDVDPKQRYYIPYSSLRNWFKNTDITVQSHPNQTLKGVTATIEDKTGSVITSAIGAAIRVASIVTGVGMAADAVKEPVNHRALYCSPAAIHALDGIKELRKKAKKADEAHEPTDHITAAIARLKTTLVRKYTTSWTPTIASHEPQTIDPQEALDLWLTPAGKEVLNAGEQSKLRISVEFNEIEKIPAKETQVPDSICGVLVRQPINGVLRVCEDTCPTGKDVTSVLKAEDHAVPQLGPFISMPLRNRIFENNTLTLEIADTGVITKLGYKTNAIADAALTSLNSDLDAISKAKTARDKAKADARTATQNAAKDEANRIAADNKAISDCLDAQAAVRKAGGTPTGTCQ